MVAEMTHERNGMTFYLRAGWVEDGWDHGYPYFAAVDVATGRTLAEDDDVSTLVATMTALYPEMALIENAVAVQYGIRSALTSVPPEGRF